MMVWSPGFRSNAQTIDTNFAQASDSQCSEKALDDIARKAHAEFQGLQQQLESKGVQVTVKEGASTSPDCIFPNNTFSTHSAVECGSSTTVFYPMLAPNRQAELSEERQADLAAQYDLVIDLRSHFDQGEILEGTGSLVLDRMNKIAYANYSPRTHKELTQAWAETMGYMLVMFDALDGHNKVVYHTNVVMWIGTHAAGICLEAIPDAAQRQLVKESLSSSGKKVIELTKAQMDAPNFAANALEVLDGNGRPMLALSAAAWAAYTTAQKEVVEKAFPGGAIAAPIPTIETYGGGSVRCMLAEIF